jgi:hypothetical protein
LSSIHLGGILQLLPVRGAISLRRWLACQLGCHGKGKAPYLL